MNCKLRITFVPFLTAGSFLLSDGVGVKVIVHGIRSVPIRPTTLSFTIKWKLGCRSRKQKRISIHFFEKLVDRENLIKDQSIFRPFLLLVSLILLVENWGWSLLGLQRYPTFRCLDVLTQHYLVNTYFKTIDTGNWPRVGRLLYRDWWIFQDVPHRKGYCRVIVSDWVGILRSLDWREICSLGQSIRKRLE